MDISLAFITQSYFFSVPKEVRLNSTHYLVMKIHNKRELQNIATNHLTDIDYKDFMKICRKCAKQPYPFLTIDTTLPAKNSLRLRKKSFRFIIKMTLTDELKIIDDKIKANQAQYDLDTEAAKISALSSGGLEKCEYLSCENLGYKPGVVKKAKFEYSPLGKVFNKGLDDKKEGLFKRLKDIEDKIKEQLNEIEYQGEKQLDMIDKQGKKQFDAINK